MVVKRFKVLENRFRKNPEFFQMYKKQIDDYIKLGHAKLLSKEESSNFSKKNYIPYHGVANVNSLELSDYFSKHQRSVTIYLSTTNYQESIT